MPQQKRKRAEITGERWINNYDVEYTVKVDGRLTEKVLVTADPPRSDAVV